MKRSLTALLAACLFASSAPAQDLAVSIVATNGDFNYYGQSGGIAAYSMAGTSCNVGNQTILWNDSARQAPMIAQSMFRITPEGSFHQLGYSWLKVGFCAINENSCGNCQSTNCDTLGLGCADTYGAGLNDGAGGVARWQLQPTTGAWPPSWAGPSGPLPLRGRLQVPTAEIADAASTFISEIHYISEDDHMNGNARNNASWREVRFPSQNNPQNVGMTQQQDPAIYAWQAEHPDVQIEEIVITDEGGAGVHGYVLVGSKATALGGGVYRYDYVVHNFNSDLSVGSFALTSGCDVSGATSRGVDHHSGSPWGNDPWSFSNNSNSLSWDTETFAQNQNANAVRWSFARTFSFTTNAAPVAGTATVGMFKNGASNNVDVLVPGSDCCSGGSISNYCTANGNSASAGGAVISANGTPNVNANDLSFQVTAMPFNQVGYFLMSQSQGFVQNFSGSQGNLCLGSPILRFNTSILDSGPFGFVQFAVDSNSLPNNAVFMAGDSWNFQMWFRDNNPNQTSNTTAGINVTFCN
ncbi:MAG: hypothetical protein ACI8QC_003958 [Planctomycetota bacterium]|jgi:hypothetical protein